MCVLVNVKQIQKSVLSHGWKAWRETKSCYLWWKCWEEKINWPQSLQEEWLHTSKGKHGFIFLLFTKRPTWPGMTRHASGQWHPPKARWPLMNQRLKTRVALPSQEDALEMNHKHFYISIQVDSNFKGYTVKSLHIQTQAHAISFQL